MAIARVRMNSLILSQNPSKSDEIYIFIPFLRVMVKAPPGPQRSRWRPYDRTGYPAGLQEAVLQAVTGCDLRYRAVIQEFSEYFVDLPGHVAALAESYAELLGAEIVVRI